MSNKRERLPCVFVIASLYTPLVFNQHTLFQIANKGNSDQTLHRLYLYGLLVAISKLNKQPHKQDRNPWDKLDTVQST